MFKKKKKKKSSPRIGSTPPILTKVQITILSYTPPLYQMSSATFTPKSKIDFALLVLAHHEKL